MAATLLPELLLALVGSPGDAFVVRGASIVLADEIDWVTPPERSALPNACGETADHFSVFRLQPLVGLLFCVHEHTSIYWIATRFVACSLDCACPLRLPACVSCSCRKCASAAHNFFCREQLNRLAALGAHYAALEAFLEAAINSNLGGPDAGFAAPPSLYRVALANGISELLDVFRSAVLRVEAHLLQLSTPPPLLTVQQFLLEVRQ